MAQMRTTIFSTPVLTPLLRLLAIVLLKLSGWNARGEEIEHQRFVLIGAPHTSNWDFPLMLLVVLKLKLRVFWMGKHTLFPFSLGWLVKWLGGIPIDRSKSHNVVSATVRQYQEHEDLVVLIPSPSATSVLAIPFLRSLMTCLRISYWVFGLCFRASIFSMPGL